MSLQKKKSRKFTCKIFLNLFIVKNCNYFLFVVLYVVVVTSDLRFDSGQILSVTTGPPVVTITTQPPPPVGGVPFSNLPPTSIPPPGMVQGLPPPGMPGPPPGAMIGPPPVIVGPPPPGFGGPPPGSNIPPPG